MDALSFLRSNPDELDRLVRLAGTNRAYFSQIAHGHRKPSPRLARKLVAASAAIRRDPAQQMDLESLLFPKKRAA